MCRNVYIADEKAMQVWEEALEVGEDIEDEEKKVEVLNNIAEKLANVNPEKAMQVIEEGDLDGSLGNIWVNRCGNAQADQ